MTINSAQPAHSGLSDLLKIFHGHRHVTTPLRHLGWATTVEQSEGGVQIRADLGDGTELAITTDQALPAFYAERAGFHVIRRDIQDPSQHTALYDSTPNGPQHHHRARLTPLFARIDELDVPKPTFRLSTWATHCAPYGSNHNQNVGGESPLMAVARYFEWCHYLAVYEGYRLVWERPEQEGYPLAVFEKTGHISMVRVTRSND